tara:strand:- start:403 stop:1317 length:915 start_codon:yes stop_codon:yes gene_type:complete
MKKLLLLLLIAPLVSFGQNIEYINSKEHKSSGMPFSQATVVNGIIYISGQIGDVNNVVVDGGIGSETKQALNNLKSVLESMNHSINDIFKCTCMLSDIKDWPEMSKAYVQFFNRKNLPARSAFAGSGLALDAKIEIECLAVYQGNKNTTPLQIIEIVEDLQEVEETVIETTKTVQQEIIDVEDDFEDLDVPFANIEDVPLFPGCESVAKSERRNCFQNQMNIHIRNNFHYPEVAHEMGIQGRVYVNFIISKDGSITNIRMRGPDKNLEKEAKRIISKLPKMIPGKQKGRPVRVPFSIPIIFRLQ